MAKRALITGAGRGIGRASSVALAAVGYDVVLVARTRDELEETAASVRAKGRAAEVVAGDVTETETLVAALGVGSVDLLVNAAGANHPEPFVEVPLERLDALMALNFRACFAASSWSHEIGSTRKEKA